MRKVAKALFSSEDQETLQRITQSAASLDKLTASLLALARLSEDNHSVTPVNLEKVIQNALSALSEEIAKTGADIQIEASCSFVGDESQLQQLFQNLIENGIKYQPAGQVPQIRILCEQQERDCTLRVRDNGVGFSQEQAERIFQPFERLHGKSSAYKGSGIGLAICKRIVERHGGTIAAESQPGHGAKFIIRLPV